MPFQYEGYRSPFANSIAELMLRRGDIAARQAEQSGNAWAGAAQNIGQAVAAIPAQIQQAQRAQLVDANLASEITDRNAQATQRTAALKANTAVDQIMQTSLKQDPTTGVFSFDRPSFEQGLIQGGMGHLYPTLAETLDKLDASATKRNAEGRTMLAETLLGIGKAGYTPQSVLSGAAFLKANQVITNDHLQPVLDAITADPSPANIQAVVTKLGTAIPEYGKLLDAEETRKAGLAKTTADTAKLTADTAKATAEADKFAAEAANLKQYGSATKPNFEQKNVTLDGKANQLVNFDPRSGQNFLPGSTTPIEPTRIKANTPPSIVIHNDNAAAPNLPTWATDDSRPTGPTANHFDAGTRMTPNGLYQAAVNYIANGQFPPTGRGSDPVAVAQRSAITSKVGAIAAASGMDEPALRAFYKANGASLAQQQKSLDAVQGFMATADKNADLLEKTLAKIPDTGVPAFNGSVRALSQKFAGNSNVSQFAIYLQSIQNEYARIISQPNLAGQLTDSARKEAEALIKPDATVKQIVDSLQALRNEGTNRLVSIGDQIQRIQQRMTVGPGGAGSQGAGNTPPPTGGGNANVATTTMPANVSAVLKGQKPGRYTLSDGSVWLVQADGSIQKGS